MAAAALNCGRAVHPWLRCPVQVSGWLEPAVLNCLHRAGAASVLKTSVAMWTALHGSSSEPTQVETSWGSPSSEHPYTVYNDGCFIFGLYLLWEVTRNWYCSNMEMPLGSEICRGCHIPPAYRFCPAQSANAMQTLRRGQPAGSACCRPLDRVSLGCAGSGLGGRVEAAARRQHRGGCRV